MAPKWTKEPEKNIFVILGKKLLIDCQAEGFPTPRIAWKKSISLPAALPAAAAASDADSSLLAASTSRSEATEHPSEFKDILSSYRYQIYGNGTFVIQEVDKSDAGLFMCQITNGIGAGLSKVIQIKVQSKLDRERKEKEKNGEWNDSTGIPRETWNI